jgi:hypothetical protein
MATIVNITAFSITSDAEVLTATNTGWTTSSTSPFETEVIRVTNNSAPNSLYCSAAAHTLGYLRNETPASANQTVRATLKRKSGTDDMYWYVGARISTNNWIGGAFARIAGGTSQMLLVKCVAGTRTTLIDSGGTLLPTDGNTGVLELRVSGASPTISASLWFNSSQIGATQTITDAALDATGKVGLFMRNFNSQAQATGVQMTTFYAEDDSVGGGSVFNPLTGRGGAAAQILGAH